MVPLRPSSRRPLGLPGSYTPSRYATSQDGKILPPRPLVRRMTRKERPYSGCPGSRTMISSGRDSSAALDGVFLNALARRAGVETGAPRGGESACICWLIGPRHSESPRTGMPIPRGMARRAVLSFAACAPMIFPCPTTWTAQGHGPHHGGEASALEDENAALRARSLDADPRIKRLALPDRRPDRARLQHRRAHHQVPDHHPQEQPLRRLGWRRPPSPPSC